MHNNHVVTPFKMAGHVHAQCLEAALSKAKDCCSRRGVNLTDIRRRVLELVWGNHEPVKAYDLLESLRTQMKGATPPTVYRALDFLQQQGFVHKIESLNAYVGCGEPGHNNAGQFLICHQCGMVAELDDAEIVALIANKAAQLGFSIESQTIEVQGLCTACRSAD